MLEARPSTIAATTGPISRAHAFDGSGLKTRCTERVKETGHSRFPFEAAGSCCGIVALRLNFAGSTAAATLFLPNGLFPLFAASSESKKPIIECLMIGSCAAGTYLGGVLSEALVVRIQASLRTNQDLWLITGGSDCQTVCWRERGAAGKAIPKEKKPATKTTFSGDRLCLVV
jgi:hypothetical protein